MNRQATIRWWIGPPIAVGILAVLFLVWLALASVILIAEAHLLSAVKWPEALGLWWGLSASPRYADIASSSGWMAAEIEAVGGFILACNCLSRLRRGGRSHGPFGVRHR